MMYPPKIRDGQKIFINGVRDARWQSRTSICRRLAWPPRPDTAARGGRRFGYFLDRINPGNRYYHKVHVFPVSRPKARTATGHRFDLANPKDGDACGSESICSGCSRPTIEVGGSGRCCTDLLRALFREASSYRLVLYRHDGLPTDGLPEGPNTSTWTLPRDPGGRTSSEALARIVATNPDGLDSLLILSPFEPSADYRIPDRPAPGCGWPPWYMT